MTSKLLRSILEAKAKPQITPSHHDAAFKALGLKHVDSNEVFINEDEMGTNHSYVGNENLSLGKIHRGIEKLGYRHEESDHERHNSNETIGLHYYQHKKDSKQHITVVHDTKGTGPIDVSHNIDKEE